MQRNTRNPYSTPSAGSRNPYSGSAQRRPADPGAQRRTAPGGVRRDDPYARRSAAPRDRRAPEAYPRRTADPYARAQAPRGNARSASRSPYSSPSRSRSGYHLNKTGKIVFLSVALILVFLLIFGIVQLMGGNRQDYANVPTLSAQQTEATAAPESEAAEADEPADDAAAADEGAQDEAQTGDEGAADDALAETEEDLTETEDEAADETASVPAAAPQHSGGLRSATIRSVGDFVIHEPIYKTAKQDDGSYDFSPMLSYIKDILGDADYTVANVDGPMGGPGKRGYKGYPQFNTPPHLMLNLKDCGVDMLTLANNHALDTYFDGLKAQIEACISCGMDYVGAARTREESATPVIKEINGIRIGFLNYTHSTNTMEKHSDKEASEYGLKIARFADFEADAKAARAAGAEVLVAYMHWGEEYEREPGSEQRHYGNKLVAAGVDVIIGGHPHVVQPAYWLEGTRTSDGSPQRTLCLSSMGNFLSDQRQKYRDGGIVFDFTIQEVSAGQFEIVNPEYIPTYVWRTGNEDAGFDYRVVPCGPYLEKAPKGMDGEAHARLVEVWYETIEHMNTGNAAATVQKK